MEKIIMPKLGLTMTEGTISQLKIVKGDRVRQGDILLAVATDKLTYEVEAQRDGFILDVMVKEGDTVPVGAVLAFIGEKEERSADVGYAETTSVPGPDNGGRPNTPIVPRVVASPQVKKRVSDVMRGMTGSRATPLARKLARDAGLDIREVPGSGPEGRITSNDVRSWLENAKSGKIKTSPMASKLATELGVDLKSIKAERRIMKQDVLAMAYGRSASEVAGPAQGRLAEGCASRVPLTPMRKVIAQRMSLSASTIPSVFYDVEVDFSEFMRFREILNGSLVDKNMKISFNDILIKICATVLMENPLSNASYDAESEEYILHGDVNIGIAVAVDDGLLVPNVKNAQDKTLMQIAKESAELIDRARKGKIRLEDMQGGTFTITNLGMFGIHDFIPIINPPEACILAVNAVVEKPVLRDGRILTRSVSMIGFSADHRILNGAEAAAFLARVRDLIENPWVFLVGESLRTN